MLLKAIMALMILVKGEPAGLRTENFLVHSKDARLQTTASRYAEVYRRDIALQWIGEVQKDWGYPHILNVGVGEPHGENQNLLFITHVLYVYNEDEAQVLYSTLPHEVCHSILAMHCGVRLPLWASEGIAMMCERLDMGAHDNARFAKLIDDIPLKEIFERDVYPLFFKNHFYGQAYSVTVYLVGRSDKKTFLNFVQEGKMHGWEKALADTYKTDFATLQKDWWAWHKARFVKAAK